MLFVLCRSMPHAMHSICSSVPSMFCQTISCCLVSFNAASTVRAGSGRLYNSPRLAHFGCLSLSDSKRSESLGIYMVDYQMHLSGRCLFGCFTMLWLFTCWYVSSMPVTDHSCMSVGVCVSRNSCEQMRIVRFELYYGSDADAKSCLDSTRNQASP